MIRPDPREPRTHRGRPWTHKEDEALKRALVRPTPPRDRAGSVAALAYGLAVCVLLAVVVWLYAGAVGAAVYEAETMIGPYGLQP